MCFGANTQTALPIGGIINFEFGTNGEADDVIVAISHHQPPAFYWH